MYLSFEIQVCQNNTVADILNFLTGGPTSMTLDCLEVLSNHLDCKSADLGKQFAQPPRRVLSSHNSEALSIGVRATVTVPLKSPKHHSATQRVWSKAKNKLCNNKVSSAPRFYLLV